MRSMKMVAVAQKIRYKPCWAKRERISASLCFISSRLFCFLCKDVSKFVIERISSEVDWVEVKTDPVNPGDGSIGLEHLLSPFFLTNIT